MTASHSASVMLASIRSRRMPALLTSTSRPPKVSTAWWTRRSAPSQSEMSSPLATASPPMASISSTTSWAGPVGGAAAVHLAAEVVDHDLGALLGEHQRVLPADAPARPVTMHTRPSQIPMLIQIPASPSSGPVACASLAPAVVRNRHRSAAARPVNHARTRACQGGSDASAPRPRTRPGRRRSRSCSSSSCCCRLGDRRRTSSGKGRPERRSRRPGRRSGPATSSWPSVVHEVAGDYADDAVQIGTAERHLRDHRRRDRPHRRRGRHRPGGTRCREDEAFPLRPFTWVGSFFDRRERRSRFMVDNRAARPRADRPRGQRRPPAGGARDPGIGRHRRHLPRPRAGSPSTPRTSPATLIQAAEDGRRPLRSRTEPKEQLPTYTDDDAQAWPTR